MNEELKPLLRMELRLEQERSGQTGRWEPCASCGVYYRLVKAGRLWLQPVHECGGAEVARG